MFLFYLGHFMINFLNVLCLKDVFIDFWLHKYLFLIYGSILFGTGLCFGCYSNKLSQYNKLFAGSSLIFISLVYLVPAFPIFRLFFIPFASGIFYVVGGINAIRYKNDQLKFLGMYLAIGVLGFLMGCVQLRFLLVRKAFLFSVCGVIFGFFIIFCKDFVSNIVLKNRFVDCVYSDKYIIAICLIVLTFALIVVGACFSLWPKMWVLMCDRYSGVFFDRYVFIFFLLLSAFIGYILSGYCYDFFGTYVVTVFSMVLSLGFLYFSFVFFMKVNGVVSLILFLIGFGCLSVVWFMDLFLVYSLFPMHIGLAYGLVFFVCWVGAIFGFCSSWDAIAMESNVSSVLMVMALGFLSTMYVEGSLPLLLKNG